MTTRPKKPNLPLTKSALLAEMEKIQVAIMRSLLEDPNRIKMLEQELPLEYVEKTQHKIQASEEEEGKE